MGASSSSKRACELSRASEDSAMHHDHGGQVDVQEGPRMAAALAMAITAAFKRYQDICAICLIYAIVNMRRYF